MPVQYSYNTTPPMDLWLVQSPSACTIHLYLYSPYGQYELYSASVPVQYSYTSTTPMDCTSYTVPQCLYSTAISLLTLWTVGPVQILSACAVQLTQLSLLFVRTLQSLSACTELL